MGGVQAVPYASYRELLVPDMRRRAAEFSAHMRRRRSVRQFDSRSIPRAIIAECLLAAGSAPSGANMQPWHFVAVSDPTTKAALRRGAEQAEREFYGGRATREWLSAVAPMGTDANKPFLEAAPWVIGVFAQMYGYDHGRRQVPHYHVAASVGISCGILIAALHTAGLAALAYTSSPMEYASVVLKRPANEVPVMLIVTGYPASDAVVPDIKRKGQTEFTTFVEG